MGISILAWGFSDLADEESRRYQSPVEHLPLLPGVNKIENLPGKNKILPGE